MKNHVLRPLWVSIALVLLILVVRAVRVPADFGVNGRNFTYGFFRAGSVDDWKAFKVKYKGKEYCNDCHDDKVAANASSPHAAIECENCHGPAIDHPDNPEKLVIDRSRELCLRCHARLAYPNTLRGGIKGIDPAEHNAGEECAGCHNPHHPNLEEM
ncbi:MAG: cytochrome c3 family protein [Thermodesulfobacteriota bacterium]